MLYLAHSRCQFSSAFGNLSTHIVAQNSSGFFGDNRQRIINKGTNLPVSTYSWKSIMTSEISSSATYHQRDCAVTRGKNTLLFLPVSRFRMLGAMPLDRNKTVSKVFALVVLTLIGCLLDFLLRSVQVRMQNIHLKFEKQPYRNPLTSK